MKKPLSKGMEGRDERGRFKAGEYKGGPGNPFAAQVQRYRQWFHGVFTQEAYENIAKKLIRKAEAGDIAAAKVVLERTLGAVPQSVKLENGDNGPLEIMVVPPANHRRKPK